MAHPSISLLARRSVLRSSLSGLGFLLPMGTTPNMGRVIVCLTTQKSCCFIHKNTENIMSYGDIPDWLVLHLLYFQVNNDLLYYSHLLSIAHQKSDNTFKYLEQCNFNDLDKLPIDYGKYFIR